MREEVPGWQPEPAADGNVELAADVAVRQLQQQVAEANDRALRAQAELENFRKRSRREMEDERRYAALVLVRDVLNVADNLQRAITVAEQSAHSDSLLAGVKMVAVQLNAYLEQHHCVAIPTVGTLFDPNLHEAIAQEPSREFPTGTVTREARSGYRLYDRVVRPAQVMVSTGPAVEATDAPLPSTPTSSTG
ncbi:MAG: nucleotide exchange factor GrpE [Planctomycetes bacterium]|nr:nucleotide exchange factor GrpE [Planctomycetota bacterium]